jgi:hypothetical protein
MPSIRAEGPPVEGFANEDTFLVAQVLTSDRSVWDVIRSGNSASGIERARMLSARLADFVQSQNMRGAFGRRIDAGRIHWEEIAEVFPPENDPGPAMPMPETTPSRDPDLLRAKALALLQEAQSIDGLKPFFAIHVHENEYGEIPYVVWAKSNPGDDVQVMFEADFDPDSEFISVYEGFDLESMVGVKGRMPEDQDQQDSVAESPTQGPAPRG